MDTVGQREERIGDTPILCLSCRRVNLMMKQSPYILPSPGSADGFINTRPRASKEGGGEGFPWAGSELQSIKGSLRAEVNGPSRPGS